MFPPLEIRIAQPDDVAACVALIEHQRHQLEQYEPRFWKKAPNSAELSERWFRQLFQSADVVALVAIAGFDIKGFIIATPVPAPPVYEPGGPTALIDDFVSAPGLWATVGSALFREAKRILRERGFAQIVVVGVNQDHEKNDFLETTDLSLASTWWTTSL